MASANERKHKVSFDDAIHVYSDPNALFTQDRVDAMGEFRWHVVGSAGGLTILLVVHTVTPEITREKFASFPPVAQLENKEDAKKKTVTKTLADSPLTPARKRRLAKLAAMPDSEIDLSDIPELSDDFWKNAVRNPYYRPLKQQVTVRLDADVVAWLKQ